ncbi:biotin-dependent carboxyltransferase family protein [Nocardioides sp. J2M5]|uniref:5-oxoprolinase subunit C family protein n=1 Tax=Nocardioides palaemonis TaxID=2829810 RepID=UPI001BAB21F3|nr:biotin-dependent carboxyltransferase family protein [Nocardioides palaemonis]MBS2938721.1 biotin-dependent carboxyltransferase family protein [Nocardioides palaemonis]
MSRALRVHAVGPEALVEDLGRRGLSGVGVGRSGAADRAALRQANRLLANQEGAAAIEVTFGGLDVEVVGEGSWCCVTGAPCPVTVDGREVGSHTVFFAEPGARVRLGAPTAGLRSYLGVRGGVEPEDVLGSRSSDVMSGLGPAPLEVGTVLPVGCPGERFSDLDTVVAPDLSGEVVLRAVRGPRDGWVADADLLVATAWTVTDRSNRVGMRLGGPPLAHARDDQLPSEGAWRGAVQVPPDGEPVLFLADHPVTGGYPVVAVVVDADVDRAAQLRPGDTVRFCWVEAP